MRDENAELRRRLNETASLEAAKKKADARVELLEEKVRIILSETFLWGRASNAL